MSGKGFIMIFSKTKTLEKELHLCKEQLNAQVKHNQANQELLTELRHFRHDIRNHLFAIQSLMEYGTKKEVLDYIDTFAEHLFPSPWLVNTENPVFDAVITSKLMEAKDHGIQIHTDFQLPANISMDPFDMQVFFSSVLNYYIEKAESGKHKELDFILKYRKACLAGSITAPFAPPSPLPSYLDEILLKYHGSIHNVEKDGKISFTFLFILENDS